MKPRIIIENHIPFIEGSLEEAGCEVRYLAARDITRDAAMDADAIVTRTRTRCDASLLEGTPVSLVATATIGTDHIDSAWCAANGIEVANAPGCNAPAVAQYVFSAVTHLTNRPLSQQTIAIIGVGHVGKIIERWAEALDMKVLRNDPPRERAEGGRWNSLEEIAEKADIITVHTPLTRDGRDATLHLIDGAFIDSLKRSPIVINAARGGIVDEAALLRGIGQGRVGAAVIDCWENEPTPDARLIERAAIATPHIAGYSRQGKIRATAAALEAVSRHFGLPAEGPKAPRVRAESPEACAATVSVRSVNDSYDPCKDSIELRAAVLRDDGSVDGAAFERLRNNYELRPEAPGAKID